MASFSPFGSIPVPKKGRTLFDESHEVSGTFPLSTLCPVFMTETIPGDSWKVNVFNTTKLETLIAPAMQRVNASLIWMKVEKRLVFRHFKKWYSGGVDGEDSHQKPHIYLYQFLYEIRELITSLSMTNDAQEITEVLFGPGTLWQYLGLPVPLAYNSSTGSWYVINILSMGLPSDESKRKVDECYIDVMPFLAYHLLHDQYFMDQSLGQKAFEDAEEGVLKVQSLYNAGRTLSNGHTIPVGNVSGKDLAEGGEVSTPDMLRLLFMYKRAWQKEYFTSALPTPQRGPEVVIPTVDGEAPVSVTGSGSFTLRGENMSEGDVLSTNHSIVMSDISQDGFSGTPSLQGTHDESYSQFNAAFKDIDGLTADLSGFSPITITAFRSLFKLQHFLEKNNVAGGRYIETILAQWAERIPDFTVQRATHLRSTSLPVQISEVTAQAYSVGVQSQLGDQAGRAKVQGNLGSVSFYTQEPSFVFALYNVVAPPSYASQGVPRLFQRITRFDEPWRDFQHIGEQAIKNRELFFNFINLAENNKDFGYQQRFSEFKYMPDRVVGDFVTTHAYWHMARMFSTTPRLNESFVTQNLDERIFAVQGVRPVTADFYFQATAKRKLSKFSTPKLT